MKAKIITDVDGKFYGIHIDCPAGHSHRLPVDWCPAGMEPSPHSGSHRWGFNGDLERPTFTPSILNRAGHHVGGPNSDQCWCNVAERIPGWKNEPDNCYLCHSFVTDGRIQFLGDCTHVLAGQAVDLLDVDVGVPA